MMLFHIQACGKAQTPLSLRTFTFRAKRTMIRRQASWISKKYVPFSNYNLSSPVQAQRSSRILEMHSWIKKQIWDFLGNVVKAIAFMN